MANFGTGSPRFWRVHFGWFGECLWCLWGFRSKLSQSDWPHCQGCTGAGSWGSDGRAFLSNKRGLSCFKNLCAQTYNKGKSRFYYFLFFFFFPFSFLGFTEEHFFLSFKVAVGQFKCGCSFGPILFSANLNYETFAKKLPFFSLSFSKQQLSWAEQL